MAQITSNEEQSVELTDKIAAMEEELKKVCRLMYGEQSRGCKAAELQSNSRSVISAKNKCLD